MAIAMHRHCSQLCCALGFGRELSRTVPQYLSSYLTMSPLEIQSVQKSLQNLRDIDTLKKLFWSQLNYERVNQTLSRRRWTERVKSELVEAPLLLASGGTDNDFKIIYARLKSERLTRDGERLVVNNLLLDHPYALFVFF